MKRLGVTLTALALSASAAIAAPRPAVLESRDVKVEPSGARIRLVASRATFANGRVVLLLALYRQVDLGFRKVKEVRVANGFKRSSRLVWLRVGASKHPNTAAVRLKWSVSPSAGARTYSYLATRTRLVRKS